MNFLTLEANLYIIVAKVMECDIVCLSSSLSFTRYMRSWANYLNHLIDKIGVMKKPYRVFMRAK